VAEIFFGPGGSRSSTPGFPRASILIASSSSRKGPDVQFNAGTAAFRKPNSVTYATHGLKEFKWRGYPQLLVLNIAKPREAILQPQHCNVRHCWVCKCSQSCTFRESTRFLCKIILVIARNTQKWSQEMFVSNLTRVIAVVVRARLLSLHSTQQYRTEVGLQCSPLYRWRPLGSWSRRTTCTWPRRSITLQS
jgi:hypothetical protein